MANSAPFVLNLGFVILPLSLLVATAPVLRPHARPVVVGATLWVILIGILSAAGFFEDFNSMPPRIPVFLLVAAILLVLICFVLPVRDQLIRAPQVFLVGIQVFRLPVELLLHSLAARSLLPVEMTFSGRNFDILTGLTAVPLALWIKKRGEASSRPLVVAWNLIGLALVTSVALHGMLSAPYSFQRLQLSIPNFIVGFFPVTLLPFFLVPSALFFHFVSLRRALKGMPEAGV